MFGVIGFSSQCDAEGGGGGGGGAMKAERNKN